MSKSRAYSNPELLARIAGLSLRARHVVEGTISGMHKSPFHGFNVEFAAYREYTPGDDLKRLDWRVYARTDRHYIKEYEEESNLRAMIALDTSRSMRYGEPGTTKYDCAATLATALATLLSQQQDPVGISLFDRALRAQLPPAATASQLVQLAELLANTEPENDTDLGRQLESLTESLKRRGMVLILSDLLTDLDRFADGLDRLRYRGHEVIVFHVLHRDELELPFRDLVQFKDIEGSEELFAEPWAFRQAYQRAMRAFLEQASATCGERGADYVLVTTDEDLGGVLSYYLHARARTPHFRSEVAVAPRRA